MSSLNSTIPVTSFQMTGHTVTVSSSQYIKGTASDALCHVRYYYLNSLYCFQFFIIPVGFVKWCPAQISFNGQCTHPWVVVTFGWQHLGVAFLQRISLSLKLLKPSVYILHSPSRGSHSQTLSHANCKRLMPAGPQPYLAPSPDSSRFFTLFLLRIFPAKFMCTKSLSQALFL